MAKRHGDALKIIDPGACNPSGIAHSLVEAYAEITSEGGDTRAKRQDPAVRLMVYQLACLSAVGNMDMDDYLTCREQCQAAIAAEAVPS